MKLFNYLLFLLLFPMIQYAVLEDDLVQLVMVLDDTHSLLETSGLEVKEYFLNLTTKIKEADEKDNYNQLVNLIIEYAKGREKPGFNEKISEKFLNEYLPTAAFELLTQYNEEFGNISKENFDSTLEKIVSFFEIDKALAYEEKLTQISDRYIMLLTAVKTDPKYEEEIEKNLDPQKNIKNLLQLFDFKGLSATPQYQKIKEELKQPFETDPSFLGGMIG